MDIIKHSYSWKSALTKRKKTDFIILHHSAGKTGTVESIHKYHRDTRGWAGIGYNFVIYKDGTVHEGRGLNYTGAHCSGYNSRSVGICCIGDFTSEYMTKAQYYALAELIKYLKGIFPGAVVKGHREFANTACPGKYFPLEEMKDYESILAENAGKVAGAEDVQRYRTLENVPDSYKQTVKKYVDKGIILGDGKGNIDLSEDMCRVLVFVDRILNMR